MIIQFYSRGGRALLGNVLRYGEKKGGRVLLGAPRLDQTRALFLNVAGQRPDLKKPYLHVGFNLDSADRDMTDGELVRIALEGMRELGFGECPVFIARHIDKDHQHLHLMVSQVDYDGRRIDLTGNYEKGMEVAKNLSMAYGLTVAPQVKGGEKRLPGQHKLAPPGLIKEGRLMLEQSLQALGEMSPDGYRIKDLVHVIRAHDWQVKPVLDKNKTFVRSLTLSRNGVEWHTLADFGDFSFKKLEGRGLQRDAESELGLLNSIDPKLKAPSAGDLQHRPTLPRMRPLLPRKVNPLPPPGRLLPPMKAVLPPMKAPIAEHRTPAAVLHPKVEWGHWQQQVWLAMNTGGTRPVSALEALVGSHRYHFGF